MLLSIAADPLPLRLDKGDTYRVGQTRVRLDTVVFEYNAGSSAEQIVGNFPTLDLADVHSVIAFYLKHKSEVDAYLQQREREAEELRRKIEDGGFSVSAQRMAEIKRRFQEERNHRA